MRDYISKPAMAAAALILVASLSGCADSTVGPFPRLGAVSSNIGKKLMSKQEKDAAIRELSLDQANQRKSAIDEIKKP